MAPSEVYPSLPNKIWNTLESLAILELDGIGIAPSTCSEVLVHPALSCTILVRVLNNSMAWSLSHC